MRYVIAIALAGVVAASGATPSSARSAVTVYATVTSSTIMLTNSTGARITRLRAGLYRFVISDRSPRGNFHLVGSVGTVNRSTTLPFVGRAGWTVKLVKGRYRFYSDGDRALRGAFRVT